MSKKEYDIYGNLILDIQIGRFECKITSEWYEHYKNLLPYTINHSKGTALFTDGYCKMNTYDEKNNILLCEFIGYAGNSTYKTVYKYVYLYSGDGRILELTELYYQVPLLATISETDNFTTVIHFVNKYDDFGNLIEKTRYDFCQPLGSDKISVELKGDMISEVTRFKNIYNDKGELFQVFNMSTMELMSEFYYVSGKLDTKVLFEHEEEKTIIKFIYSESCLSREEYYSKSGARLKIIEHVTIRGRMCQKVLSPANDGFRWFLTEFDDSGCSLVVNEEILTKEVLLSIYNYINSQSKSREYFCINFDSTDELDISTYEEELNQIIEKNRKEHNIEYRYTN